MKNSKNDKRDGIIDKKHLYYPNWQEMRGGECYFLLGMLRVENVYTEVYCAVVEVSSLEYVILKAF